MSLSPSRYHLEVWEGATFRKTITWLTGDLGSAPTDLSGFIAEMVIRIAPDTTPLYTLSTGNGRITLGGTAGTIALMIPAADTLNFDAWDATGALYELTVTASGGTGDVTSLLWGPISVRGIA